MNINERPISRRNLQTFLAEGSHKKVLKKIFEKIWSFVTTAIRLGAVAVAEVVEANRAAEKAPLFIHA